MDVLLSRPARKRTGRGQRADEGSLGNRPAALRYTPPKLDFLGQSGPANYVAGSLRHDKGFSLTPEAAPLDSSGGGRPAAAAHSLWTQEDREADEAYDAVERKLCRRDRKGPRPQDEKPSMLNVELRADLQRMTEQDWLSLPEPGDFRVKRLKRLGNFQDPRVKERFLPLPDNLIRQGHAELSPFAADQPSNRQDEGEKREEENEKDRLLQAGQAREVALGLTLDRVALQLKPQAPELAEPEEEQAATILDEESYERSKRLLKSVLRGMGDAPLASAHLSLARLEERQGRRKSALQALARGVQTCPDDGDLWIDLIRLTTNTVDRQALIRRALDSEAGSSRDLLWLAVIHDHTPNLVNRRTLYLQSLERLPRSARLWSSYADYLSPAVRPGADEGQEEVVSTLEAAIQCVEPAADRLQFVTRLVHILLQRCAEGDLQRAQQLVNAMPSGDDHALLLAGEIMERTRADALYPTLDRIAVVTADMVIGSGMRQSHATSAYLATRAAVAFEPLLRERCFPAALSVYRQDPNVWRRGAGSHAMAEFLRWASQQDPAMLNDWYRHTGDVDALSEAIERGVADEEATVDYVVKHGHAEYLPQALARFPLNAQLVASHSRQDSLDEKRLGDAMDRARRGKDAAGLESLWLTIFSTSTQDATSTQNTNSEPLLRTALKDCPHSAQLWLRYAECHADDVPRQRAILSQARVACPASEDIWQRSLALEPADSVGLGQLKKRLPASLQHLLTR